MKPHPPPDFKSSQRLALAAALFYLAVLVLALAFPSAWSVPSASGQTVPAASTRVLLPFVANRVPGCNAPPLAPVIWDPRLGPGGLPHLENVRIISATVSVCQEFWRAVSVKFEDYYESGNDHTIYIKLVNASGVQVFGNKVEVTSESGLPPAYPEEKAPGNLCDCNFDYPLYGDAYDVQVILPAIPSDTVAGMVMPSNRHVNYRITFQRVLNPP